MKTLQFEANTLVYRGPLCLQPHATAAVQEANTARHCPHIKQPEVHLY